MTRIKFTQDVTFAMLDPLYGDETVEIPKGSTGTIQWSVEEHEPDYALMKPLVHFVNVDFSGAEWYVDKDWFEEAL